ncbi:MAG: hypothetical protein ABRQ39_12260, partial [Candidatus Eremiobacterota bacterium]
MYTYIQKHVKINKEYGLTILELVISCIVFALFMVAVYATMDVGLRSWQIGESKTNIHQRVEILLNRIVKEVMYSNIFSLQIFNASAPNTYSYLCFETALNKNDNNFTVDCSSTGMGCPVWQGYILYYLQKDGKDASKKNVYRQFIDRDNPAIQPLTLSPISNFTSDISSSKVRTVVRDIYSMDLSIDENILTVKVSFKQHIHSNASVAFSP